MASLALGGIMGCCCCSKQLHDKDIELKEKDKQLKDALEQLKTNSELIEFLKVRFYRVDVILDPSTAHPRLEVSPNGKCVRDTGNVLKFSYSEERFDSHMFVLAKEGFVEGKHYWEVEVGPKMKWDLGVASASISRKGTITLSPQNGYWVIGRDDRNDYWARTEPWTHLEARGNPTKIGMFLNMPDGSLTFYDVNKRSKLHISNFRSSEVMLYPFFSVGYRTSELDSLPLQIPSWLEEDNTE